MEHEIESTQYMGFLKLGTSYNSIRLKQFPHLSIHINLSKCVIPNIVIPKDNNHPSVYKDECSQTFPMEDLRLALSGFQAEKLIYNI